MSKNSIRVRFAPAPTGMMHLGNVRTALLNYLFAKRKGGTFVLRIEDTDSERNYDPEAKEIIHDLHWLGLDYDEGPYAKEPYKPYFQSQRTPIYQKYLNELIENNGAYRCFCSPEELEKKRERQIALKQPPRYDRHCLNLSEQEIAKRLSNDTPFIWRVKLDHEGLVSIHDLAHGTITFDFKNFSDFPISRKDGSFTFIFANFVDDMTMEITHVFRGDDHLTNTANQAGLYKLFGKELPTFWHMPILCNKEGKKLSKRDFGFSLRDLQKAGFTPEAICNYLAIIGSSFEEEIMSLEELTTKLNFDNPPSAGHIKYDVEKLQWLNHKWIDRYTPEQLALACRPFLEDAFAEAKNIPNERLADLLKVIKTDLVTLKDAVPALYFYFEKPTVTADDIANYVNDEQAPILASIISEHLDLINNPEQFAASVKKSAQEKNLPLKPLFSFIRLALTGKATGPSIHDLASMLGQVKTKERLEDGLELLGRVR